MKGFRELLVVALLGLGGVGDAPAAVEVLAPGDAAGESFPLVSNGNAAPIVVRGEVPEVIRIAVGDLVEDIGRVTGTSPELLDEIPDNRACVIVGIDPSMEGRWEAFRFLCEPGRLVVAGSDARGTAYAVYELSRRIGVSPWHWWADVPVARREALRLSPGETEPDEPAVRYRGIFINDEDWGLEPWARQTFEPQTGTIGPETYARMFELMLRLRANTLWPAMHECTTAFHQVPGNAETADRYAIVLGSSHAEPMLRNNVGEWTRPKDQYNFLSHRDEVLGYWEERVSTRSSGESLFTIGMRGVHDSAIQGPRGQEERIETLEQIFEEQRALLAEHLGGGDPEKVAQVFCPYKEVLADYRAGLEVPEDVTLMWPDDNFGYIRRFPNDEERKRSGGSGVYYHLSYLGNPLAWLWFDSLPPAFVWSEMHKAYELGVRDIWVGNVGDMKGNEQMTEWFLDLAWHADEYGPESGGAFLERMAERDFGAGHAKAIADLWRRHQALAFERKPEHMQWHLSLTPYQPSTMTTGEIRDRLAAYEALATETDALVGKLPDEAQDAAFQLLAYPILCARAANQRYFHLELLRRGADDGELAVAREADRRIGELTRRYNEEIAGGKWRHIMSANGISQRDWIRFQPEPFEEQVEKLANTRSSGHQAANDESGELPTSPGDLEGPGFVERDGVVSMHAGNFTGRSDADDGGWQSVPGLGRSGSAVTVLPATCEGEARLSYRFHVAEGAPATVHLRLLPTHPVDGGDELRVAVSIDSGEPLVMSVKDPDPKTVEWKMQVMTNATEASVELPGELAAGWHTLELVSTEPGVVVDKIVIDLGGLQPSYRGPAETRIRE